MLDEILKKASMWDVLILVIASLAIVGFWRGVWNMLDHYLFPGDFLLSQIISILGGIIVLIGLSEYN